LSISALLSPSSATVAVVVLATSTPVVATLAASWALLAISRMLAPRGCGARILAGARSGGEGQVDAHSPGSSGAFEVRGFSGFWIQDADKKGIIRAPRVKVGTDRLTR
jgi:hypothetical protein